MTERMRTVMAICAAGATVCLAAEAQVQWVNNPEMALQEDQPTGWRFQDFRTGGTPVVTSTEGRSGSSAVGIEVASSEQRGCWVQRIDIGDHRFVQVQGWYRTEGLTEANRRGATIRMTYRGEGGFLGDHRYYLPPAAEWQRFEFTDRVIGNGRTVALELFNFFVTGTVWYDDVTCGPGTLEDWLSRAAERLDQPPAADQVGYAPADGEMITFTPPAFRWIPVQDVQSYAVQWSRNPDFRAEERTERRSSLCIFTPHETLSPGTWWWRYGMPVEDADLMVWSRPRQFEIAREPMEFPRPSTDHVVDMVDRQRPRVFFTPRLVERIRTSTDPAIRAMVRSAARSAERYIGEALYPEPPRLPGEHTARRNAYQEIFRTMRPWTSGMERCAQAYILTGERRFGEEARRRLLHFASWDPSGSTSVFHNDEPAMDLAKRGPRTYDWIADLLTAAERQRVVEAWRVRLHEINQLHRRRPFESRPFSSHAGRMVPFVVEGSIVFLHEIEEARDWLEYTLHLMWNTYPAWGSADGGWHEGPSYWGAYIGMMTRNVFGFGQLGDLWKQKPFFQNTGDFGLYAVPAFAKQRPFGDGHGGNVSRGQAAILYNHASLHDNPHYRWYAEIMGIDSGTGPEAFLAYRPDLHPVPPTSLPQARLFGNIGLVAMHSSLADPTGAVQMLFKSDPYGSVSHNHASQNAFAINAFGEALAISSGYYQQYGCPHHAEWTWSTKAHNAITIDGQGQKKRSRDSRGSIAQYWNDDRITYCVGNAAEAYDGRLERAHRHVIFLRPDTFVLIDDLRAPKPVSAEWWLHARQEMTLARERRAVTIAQGKARLETRFLLPESLRFEQTDEFPVTPHVPTSPNQWHVTVTPEAKRVAPVFVSILRAYREGDAEVPRRAASVNREGERFDMDVTAAGYVARVRLRPAEHPGNAAAAADLLTITTWTPGDRELTGYVGVNVSSFSEEGHELVESSSRLSASAHFGSRAARVMVTTDQAAACAVHLPARYPHMRSGERAHVVNRAGNTLRLRLPPGSHDFTFETTAAQPVADALLSAAAGSTERPLAAAQGAYHTAWLARSDGFPEGLCEAVVHCEAPRGGPLILTAGTARHAWRVEPGTSETRFRWVMPAGGLPLVALNPHGMDTRVHLRSVRIEPLASAAALVPVPTIALDPGAIQVEAESFASFVGPAQSVRSGDYVCSDALLYGLGDLVTRVEYEVEAPRAGAYSLVFKHATDRGQTALRLLINGSVPHPSAEMIVFGPTGGWGYQEDQWRVQALTDADGNPLSISLKQGVNRITLEGQGGRMHLDWFAFSPRH